VLWTYYETTETAFSLASTASLTRINDAVNGCSYPGQ